MLSCPRVPLTTLCMVQLGTSYIREAAIMGTKWRPSLATSMDAGLSASCAVDA